MKKSTCFLLAIVGSVLLGCGSKDSAILSAIDDYAATKGLPGQACNLIAKDRQNEASIDIHYYGVLIDAGYMEKTPTGGKLTALGLSKIGDNGDGWYRFCWMDLKAQKVTAYDDSESVKTSDGGEILRVGVDIKQTLSEMGETMVPIVAKKEVVSEDAVIKRLQRGDGPTYNRWIRMKKSADGKYTVFDASY